MTVKLLGPRAVPVRLTSRECAVLLGGALGGLIRMADLDAVRDAVRWWAETDDAWETFEAIQRLEADPALKRGFDP